MNATIAFYSEMEQLYLETDSSSVGLGTCLLQAMDGLQFPRKEAPNNTVLLSIVFTSKSMTNAETHYSNTEREVLSIIHGPEKIYYHCFTCEVNTITDHKLLVAIFKKDVASLSYRLQRILLCIHQYSI